jgi:raffinose/stachyose/melibiose transport system permease protein
MRTNILKRNLWITFFVLPGLLLVAVFIILPLFLSMFNSLYHWDGLVRTRFVGVQNFINIFFNFPYNERFFNAIKHNIIWFVLTMVFQNCTGLVFGYLLSKKIWGHTLYRRIFFIPAIFSIVAVGFLWTLYLNPQFGIINKTLKSLGLQQFALPWLGDTRLATPTIIAVNIWRWLGFPTLVFLAGINSIPESSLEAAYLDGAGETSIFFRIVIPLIVPSITIITILTLIGSLNVFEQVYVMEGVAGGPFYSTDTLGTLFYRTAFGAVDTGRPEIGIGSAIGVVIYILTFLASAIAAILLRKREVEQ